LFSAFCVLVAPARAEMAVARTQSLQLQAGWNAVFLEVEPLNADPKAVFAGMPVDIVARYFPSTSPVQYISDPAETAWSQPGWGVWYAPSRPDGLLSTLKAIHGNRAYLIHATANHSWSIEGRVTFERIRWQADSFNLVGFGVNEQAPPTFGSFFAGATGQIGDRVYRLVNGRWEPVSSLATAPMRAGEACWVYCRGKTDYQGPVSLRVPGTGVLDFGAAATELKIEVVNQSGGPVNVAVEPLAGAGDLPLTQVVRDLTTLNITHVNMESRTNLPALGAGQQQTLRLGVRRAAMNSAEQSALLKVSTDQGVRFWLPVSARRADLVARP
jgi:hypothetical protein